MSAGEGDSPSRHEYEKLTVGGKPLEEIFTRAKQSIICIEEEKQEATDFNPLVEGDRETASRYTRNATARHLCLEHFGFSCQVCSVRLRDVYHPEGGDDFIHVHHLNPFNPSERARAVDPPKDLVPVCPNCHAMLHLGGEPMKPLTQSELKQQMSCAPQRLTLMPRHAGGGNVTS